MSLSRQLLFLLPCLLIFPRLWGINGVWFSMPAADLISSIVAAVLLTQHFRQFKRKELEEENVRQEPR
jgi:Na+-driven multidrug efflux pump